MLYPYTHSLRAITIKDRCLYILVSAKTTTVKDYSNLHPVLHETVSEKEDPAQEKKFPLSIKQACLNSHRCTYRLVAFLRRGESKTLDGRFPPPVRIRIREPITTAFLHRYIGISTHYYTLFPVARYPKCLLSNADDAGGAPGEARLRGGSTAPTAIAGRRTLCDAPCGPRA